MLFQNIAYICKVIKNNNLKQLKTKFMSWLKNPLIKKNVVAKLIGVTPQLLQKKMDEVNRNRFTPEDQQKLEVIKNNLRNELDKD